MKVKGTQTSVQRVDVELDEAAIKSVVYAQSVESLAKAIQERLQYRFLHSLEPKFSGERAIHKGYGRYDGKLVLVHIDASWNNHNNVGEDEDIRALTDIEEQRYKDIMRITELIDVLNTK